MGERSDREIFQDGWNHAAWLYLHLAEGGNFPVPETMSGLRLDHYNNESGVPLDYNEDPYADTELEYARFYETNENLYYRESVVYEEPIGGFTLSPTRLIGNAIHRAWARRQFDRACRELDKRAEERYTAQWGDRCLVRAVLTDQRILCNVRGGWLSFWHAGIVYEQSSITLEKWRFELCFDSGAPLMLRGPEAPAYALSVAYFTHGNNCAQWPAFAPLADPSAPMPPYYE